MAQRPFLYNAVDNSSRFPEPKFDPKAVSRASWEPKPRKPKPTGPLVTFNRHPDAHLVLSHRSGNYVSLSSRTKSWIKGMRIVQLALRVLQLVAAAGLIALLVLLDNIEPLAGWVLRVTPGVVMLHCLYAVFHLSRPAGGRSPASSTAYQLFAGISDLGVMPLYAYGALTTKNNSPAWTARWIDQDLLNYFLPAVLYTFIGAASLHLVSLGISTWLGLMFRRITQMPPDMNPLEDHLTTRAKHKRNKSNVSTNVSGESEKRLSTPLEGRRQSDAPYEDVSRPPSIPFQRTRAGSDISNSIHDFHADLPSRQYHIAVGNTSRYSIPTAEHKRMSAPGSSHRGSYTEVPLSETIMPAPQASVSSMTPSPAQIRKTGRFTETWFATDSLISRTQKRNRAINAAAMAGSKKTSNKPYKALGQRYNPDNSDSGNDEDDLAGSDFENDLGMKSHPDPLGSNPHPSHPSIKTPYYLPQNRPLSEVNLNSRRISGSNDIADERPSSLAAHPWPRNRDSSIQPESDFYSKPYGELKPATPPVMVGSNRQVSSGNDLDDHHYSSTYARRNVSGKVAEEGLAGSIGSYSRYGILQDGR